MGPFEQRISRISHPDLSFDAAKDDRISPRTSWRPSWFPRSSISSHSIGSSLSTSRSDSVSTRRATADMHNTYQLPVAAQDQTKALDRHADSSSPVLSDMRYEFMDETFEFPLPAVIQHQQTSEVMYGDVEELRGHAQSDVKNRNKEASECCSSTNESRISSSTGAQWQPPSEPSLRSGTSMSICRKTRDPKSDQETELEMVSKEQFGYWSASFVARIPDAAALCGALLLTAKLPMGQAADQGTTIRDSAQERTALDFSNELYRSTTPEEVMRTVWRQGLESAGVMLKDSLDTAQTPGVPVKIAVAMFKKLRETNEKERHKLWPHILKQLKKLPQDRLVLLMFLVCIAQRLERRGLTIDGHEPSLYLLSGLWPPSLAVNDDPLMAQRLSRLLVSRFDEIPADLPTMLTAVNYRFASGKRFDMMALMTDKRDKIGPSEVREIVIAQDRRTSQW